MMAANPSARQKIIHLRSEVGTQFRDTDRQRISRRASRWQPGDGALDDVLKAEVHTP